jgi:hypothetical protein
MAAVEDDGDDDRHDETEQGSRTVYPHRCGVGFEPTAPEETVFCSVGPVMTGRERNRASDGCGDWAEAPLRFRKK